MDGTIWASCAASRHWPSDEGTHHPDDPRATAGQLLEWRFWDAIYIVDLSVDELMARPELRDKII